LAQFLFLPDTEKVRRNGCDQVSIAPNRQPPTTVRPPHARNGIRLAVTLDRWLADASWWFGGFWSLVDRPAVPSGERTEPMGTIPEAMICANGRHTQRFEIRGRNKLFGLGASEPRALR
jgi:hypothetical protein